MGSIFFFHAFYLFNLNFLTSVFTNLTTSPQSDQKTQIFVNFGYFCLNEKFLNVKYFYSKGTNPYNQLLIIKNGYFNYFLLNKLDYSTLSYPFDLTSSADNNLIFCILHCYKTQVFNTVLYIPTAQHYSLTSLYKGFTWGERELKEFSTLYIKGLTDSRRLLTDYTTTSHNYLNGVYNQIFQEVL